MITSTGIIGKAIRWTAAAGLCAFLLGTLAISAHADSGTGGPKAITNTDISFTWSPSVLWPPNHTLSAIVITAHDARTPSDPDTGTYSITVTKITSSEDGCGDTGGPDWLGVGTSSGSVLTTKAAVVAIHLRAERCGKSETGRTYTVTVVATDDDTVAGVHKTGTATFTVTVPHDQSN